MGRFKESFKYVDERPEFKVAQTIRPSFFEDNFRFEPPFLIFPIPPEVFGVVHHDKSATFCEHAAEFLFIFCR